MVPIPPFSFTGVAMVWCCWCRARIHLGLQKDTPRCPGTNHCDERLWHARWAGCYLWCEVLLLICRGVFWETIFSSLCSTIVVYLGWTGQVTLHTITFKSFDNVGHFYIEYLVVQIKFILCSVSSNNKLGLHINHVLQCTWVLNRTSLMNSSGKVFQTCPLSSDWTLNSSRVGKPPLG